jgi:NADPH:quinone reductase-like Zn-dependent oxidoreductase
MNTQQTILFHKYGGPEVIEVYEIPLLEPSEDEVRFKVNAFALNRADLLFINGHHYTLPEFPSRIGSEATGIVDKIGKNVTKFKIGEKVTSIPFYTQNHGVQGEYAIVPEIFLTHSPDNLNDVEACSIWMQYLTPYFALIEIGKVQPNEYVLVPAASGSAGLGTLQLLKYAGAKVIATTRTKEKAAFLKKAGADYVVIMDEKSLSKTINEITNNKGVRLIFDPIGGSFLNNYTEVLATNAIIFLYGLLSGEITEVPIVQMVRKNAIIYPYSMFNYVVRPDMLERGKSFILKGIKEGLLHPIIDKIFSFNDTRKAYQYMESNNQKGKIVVKLN